jgi:4-alpha-glucanotransferase
VIGEQLLEQRSSGILLHATSLPGPYGAGDLGPAAYAFADWLAAARQSWWQLLPVGPPGTGGSPYDSPSSFAGSPWLISLELLVRDGLLDAHEIAPRGLGATGRARLSESERFREPRLRLAFERFRGRRGRSLQRELERFRSEAADWLDDWALFSALRQAQPGVCWTAFAPELRDRRPAALRRARQALEHELAYHRFVQLLFARQWSALREHCGQLGIALLGDLPMFVAHDGAEVWAQRELFLLDAKGERTAVAGVPPDAFSAQGQLWGNPLYRWARLRKSGYAWWIARFRATLSRFDAVRLDHFIGFRRHWEVPAHARSAKRGRFVRVPGEELFERVRLELGGLPFVAEDLGLVTEEVHALRERFGLPGMRVLAFAFGGDGSDYLPHRYPRKTVVYTGTHDNDTTVGWFSSLRAAERARVLRYVGGSGREIHWDLIRLASMSVANLALFPLQDVLGLGSAARMNSPGTTRGNWGWRFQSKQLSRPLAERLGELTRTYERASGGSQ